jgi:predicted Zn-dependent protease
LTLWGLLATVALVGLASYQWTRYSKVRSAYLAAQQAADRQDWRAAAGLLKEALIQWPDRPDFHLLAARVERRLDHHDEAKRHLDAYQTLQGETSDLKVERALLRVYTGGLSEVETFLRERIQKNDPATTEILDTLAAAYELNYRDAEAQRCLDQLLQRQPDNFHALVRRGRTARNMEWYEDAIHYFEKALALRPEVDNVRLMLAETQGIIGRFHLAREHFERLSKQKPQDPGLQFGIALCAAGTGEHDLALKLFNQLLVLNPNNWMVLQERGKLAVQMDRPDLAVEDLRKADQLAPPDAVPIPLVNCLNLLGQQEEARKYQQKVDRIQADQARVAQLSDQIREHAPNDPELRYELGQTLLRLGKQREAIHWLRTATEKDPDHRKSHEALVEIFQSVNERTQAERHRRILQRLPAAR